MIRYIFVLDVAFAALGAAMVIGVGASAFLLGWHLDVAPEQRGSMNTLLLLTAAYSAVTLAAAAGAWGIHRKAGWHWLAQLGFVVALIVSYFVSVKTLTNQ